MAVGSMARAPSIFWPLCLCHIAAQILPASEKSGLMVEFGKLFTGSAA